MTAESLEQELEAANAAFYDSFEALSLDRMEALWLQEDGAFCVHPGAEVVRGWGRVRRSWAAVFAGMDYIQFIVTNVRAQVQGELGVVSCVENVLAGEVSDHLHGGTAVATNLFVRRDGAWRMLAHHASPMVRVVEQ